MKKIWYAAVETIEVPDNSTDEEIDAIILAKVHENAAEGEIKDYMWSKKDNLLID